MGKDYLLIGYCGARNLYDITEAQAKKLTHVNVAFGVVKDGKISADAIRAHLPYIKKLRAYNPKLNFLLSTVGGDPPQCLLHAEATRTPEGIRRIVSSTMEIVREYDLDGVDVDWEYPGKNGDRAEKFRHTALLRAYRSELDAYAAGRGRKCYLSIAAACSEHYVSNVELPKLVDILDHINLMCYDFRWESAKTGHHCNTFSVPHDEDPVSAQWAADLFCAAGCPYEKIVLGAAFYSHRYDGVTGGGGGYGQPYTGGYSYGPNYTEISQIYEKSPAFVKHWDEIAKEPWLFDGDSFITYDDPMAMRHKCDYVKKTGLAGVMYWEHSGDKTGVLLDTIYDCLKL
ncbi:MAG: glycosyl hydrolase family 18 protein [Defluviitaleaceae bacterium]|nr:glycosyl hydrolase family 18 protein [Defluviitaleaceae bacterium]